MVEKLSRGVKPLDTTITQAEIDACLDCVLPDCRKSDPECQLSIVRMEIADQKRRQSIPTVAV